MRPDLTPNAGERTQTAHGANGVVPLAVGGPLPVGARIIGGPYETPSHVYFDLLICEGPIESITGMKSSGRTWAQLGMVEGTDYVIHLGADGDTAHPLLTTVDGAYAYAAWMTNIAHIEVRFPRPNQTTGNYNPLDFECTVKGLRCTDPATGTIPATASTNPHHHMYEAKISTRWGEADAANAASAAAAAALCDTDIDPGAGVTKRWEISQYFDRDMPAPDFFDVIRLQCASQIVFAEEWKAFVDVARAATGVVLRDRGTYEALNCDLFRFETMGSEDVPTVTVVDWTDASNGFKDASVQYPDPAPAGRYLEHRIPARGITTAERARRLAYYAHKAKQYDKLISTDTLQVGLKLEPGDRIQGDSRMLKSDASLEDLFVVQPTMLGDRWRVACELYRTDRFSDTIDPSGPPVAPPLPDEYSIPPAVTGVEAPSGTEDERGRLRWNPSAFNWIREYLVLDLHGDPAEPPVVATVLRETNLNAAGKYEIFVPSAIHGTPATGRSFKVAIVAVSIHSRQSARATASWTVGTVLTPRTKILYGRSTSLSRTSLVSWADAQGGTADSVTQNTVFVRDEKTATPSWKIDRDIMEWEARGKFPSDATITGVALELYVEQNLSAARNLTAHVSDVNESGLGEHPFDTSDYDNLGATSYGSRLFTDTPYGGYLRIPSASDAFLAAGANAKVNLTTGKTFFGLRTANDINNIEPTVGDLSHHFTARGDADVSPGPRLILQYTSALEDAGGGGGGAGGGISMAVDETPIGVVDGVNAVFNLNFVPLGGVEGSDGPCDRVEGCHYDRSGKTITFREGWIPRAGRSLRFTYAHAGS